ncbi:hypothetical protein D9615_003139 [Tricholomella constricta]|uniref:Phosphatidate cytidylyltransferase n=1 Tax=Tricholomella constricta TaxID=117010 RepID=A0A8H5HJG7_9AGAR|nr:hypothetical protein D9615_003139 [Tricholomella constricta]
MVRISVLNDCLNNIVNAERRGKRQVLIRPSSKVVVKFLSVMQRHGEHQFHFSVLLFLLLFFCLLAKSRSDNYDSCDFASTHVSTNETIFPPGYIGEFEIIDDHRSGKIVIQLNGRLNKTGVISPRFNVQATQIESWVNLLMPARGFGIIILTTSSGILDHEEARRKNIGGKLLGYLVVFGPFLSSFLPSPTTGFGVVDTVPNDLLYVLLEIMTARESVLLHVHDSSSPRRRRSQSSASSRSLSSKRSPSPIVTFSPTPLSADAKGVKNITRKVIKTLEGLGHLDDMDEQDCESDEKCDLSEVEATLNGAALHSQPSSQSLRQRQNGSAVASPTPSGIELKKIDWEIPRKLLHSSIGFFTVYLYVSNGDVKTVIFVLWTALAVIIPADILRLRSPAFERIYERFLGFLMRESEKNSSNGVIWYILGVNFALTFYPQDVATVAILILSWADTTASFFGRLFGSKTPRLPSRSPVLGLPLAPRKSLAGFIAATITGACIAVGFWGWVAPVRGDLSWWWDGGVRSSSTLLSSLGFGDAGLHGAGGWAGLGAIGLVAGLVSGVAEALDVGSLDDNLTLPIISGGCILGFLKLLGLFSTPS